MTVRPLGEVATFIRGVTFKPHDVVSEDTPGTIWCMRTKNVQRDLDLSDTWSISSTHAKRKDQYLQAGDILVSSANSWNLIGKCCWVPELRREATFGGFISVLRANPTEIDPRYLYRWFSWPMVQASVRSFGRQTTNISNLDIRRCLQMPLLVPSLEEQQRVVEVLDQADELRAKRRRATMLLDSLSQSLFLDMFGHPRTNPKGWKIFSFDSAVHEFRYGTSNKSGSEGLPALRIPNVLSGKLDLHELKLVPVTETEADRLELKNGDLLFVRTNGNPDYVGRCAVFSEELTRITAFATDRFIYASYLIRARLRSEHFTPEFVREFMLSPTGRRALREHSKTSAGQFNINVDGLRRVSIPRPPLKLQSVFTNYLSEIEDARAVHEAHLARLDELFGCLQAKAFRGEL